MSENIDFDDGTIIGSYSPEEQGGFNDKLKLHTGINEKKNTKEIVFKTVDKLFNFLESVKLPLNYRARIIQQKIIKKQLYSTDDVTAFEKGKELIHEYYYKNQEKLYSYALNAFSYMEKENSERLKRYCELMQIKKNKESYAEFVLKQLQSILDKKFSNVKLAIWYDYKKLTPFESSNHYGSIRSTAYKAINSAIINMHEFQTPKKIKSITIHESEHLVQYALDGNLKETKDGEISLIEGSPIYVYAHSQIKEIFKKSIVQTIYISKEKKRLNVFKKGIINRATMRRKMKNEGFNEKPFYFDNIVEITPKIRELQLRIKEKYGDDTLTLKRLKTTDENINKIVDGFKERVKEGKIEELFDWANNSFF